MDNKIIGRFIPVGKCNNWAKPFFVLTKEPSDYLAPAWKGIMPDGGEYHVIESAWKFEPIEWDGEGLPPVGSKVSFFYNERYDYNEEIIPQDGQELEVVAHKTTTDEHDVAVCYWDENGGGMAVCLVPGSLRPIRSEADKKRDEIIEALKEGLVHAHGLYDLMQIYHLLNNGKIPHIRID
nr:hypothetical protein [Escherichia coli]